MYICWISDYVKVENNTNILNKYPSLYIFDVPFFSAWHDFKFPIPVKTLHVFCLIFNCGSFFFPLLILISACSNFPLFLKPGGTPLICVSLWRWCIPPQLILIQKLSSAQTCSVVERVPPSSSYFTLTTRCPLNIILDLWAAFQIIPVVYVCVALALVSGFL